MEVTSVTGRQPRRDSASPPSVLVLQVRRVPQVSQAVTELQAVLDCRVEEERRALLARMVTRASRAVTERTDCQEREVCQGRMDWMESRDRLEPPGCQDLRARLVLPGQEEGLETKERLALRVLWAHLDRLALMAAMDLLGLLGPQVLTGHQDLKDLWDLQDLRGCRERPELQELEDCRDLPEE